MPKYYEVTEGLLSKFKEPFGLLIRGSPSENMYKLKQMIDKDKPEKIISVGDKVSINLHKYNIIPQVSITDNRSMRRKLHTENFTNKTVLRIKNPQGTITEEAINSVREAVKGTEPIQIVVDGEEDLLALIAAMYAPEGSLIIYGQPKMGIVLVRVDQQKKDEAKEIFSEMTEKFG